MQRWTSPTRAASTRSRCVSSAGGSGSRRCRCTTTSTTRTTSSTAWSTSSWARSTCLPATSTGGRRCEGEPSQPGRCSRAIPGRAHLIDSRESSGPERLRYFDWVIGTLRRAGFSVELAVHAFSAIDSYVYGFGRQQLNMSAGEADATPEEMAEAFLSAIPADEYPYLSEVTEYMLRAGYDESADFEFGLGLILDGLERARDSARHS